MNEKQRKVILHNLLVQTDGRLFILDLLAQCGVALGQSISYRPEKSAHEVGLDLLHEIMYNHTESLNKLISDNKILLEVVDGRGNNSDDE